MKPSHDRLLRVIAVFKFFKSASLIALSIGAFRILHKDAGETAEHWVRELRLAPGNRYVEMALTKASMVSPKQIKEIGLGGLIYAALFFAEGTGLWLRKRWGEWLTIAITSTLVPVEVYEIFRHPSTVKVIVLAMNVAIVVYLVWRIRTKPE
jgi:uncharacterized membrane protein (DUF2068 family)